MAIPVRINVALSALVPGALAVLLVGASRGWPLWACAPAFALLFQTQFALLHEAVHGVLHPDKRANHALGVWLGLWFPLSFSALQVAHNSHHDKNRSPEERFDVLPLRATRARAWLGRGAWTLGMLGAWYASIPLWNAALALVPGVVRAISVRLRIGDRVFRNPRVVRHARLEVLVVVLGWAAFAHAASLSLAATAVLYGAAAFWWSSIQYLQHAFSPLDRVEGSHDLRAPRWYSLLILHYELHRAHHRHPHVPWIHLPALAPAPDGPSYARQWLRMWRGPVHLAALPEVRI